MHTAMTMTLAPQLRCALAPELRQSLRLLQMPAADLLSYLREAEENNPLIELEWPESCRASGRRGRGSYSELALPYELAGRGAGDTLEQAMLGQIRLSDAPESAKRSATFLAGNLNADGYLDIAVEEAARCLGVPVEAIEEGLCLLQSLEPAGIGARSLEESLLLQASHDGSAPAGFHRLVREHLTDLAKGRWKAIAKAMDMEERELQAAIKYLRSLNPRPGGAYASSDAPHVIPEAKLALVADDLNCTVRMAWPIRLRVRMFASEGGDAAGEWRRWVAASRKEAFRLKGMLRFRENAMHAVIVAIAARQSRFLREGPAAIRPLNLETIADETGYHLSTVSRAVRDKFVETPFGVLPLSRFFSAGLAGDGGSIVSARSVKHRIRSLIARENKSRPLTDIQLAEALRQEGISISRRTVAKYREEERLLPSAMRGFGAIE